MKIILEIPEEFEDHFISDRFEDSLQRLSLDSHLLAGNYEKELANMLINAFSISEVLPKGHGRLIDADELKTLSYEVLVEDGNSNRADGLSSYNGLVEDDIDEAPTIIKADKEE